MYTIRELANLIAGTTNLTASEAFNYMIDGFPNSNRTMKEALAHLYNKGVDATAGETLNSILGTSGKTVQECLTALYARIVNLDETTHKGGVLRVIDSATGDIARTTSGFIEDEKFGIWANVDGTAISEKFDSSITRTGRLTINITTTNATGRGKIIVGYNGATGTSLDPVRLSKYGIPLKPSTSYRVKVWVNYTNLVSAQAVQVFEHDISGARKASDFIAAFSGNSNGWVEKTLSFTTNATSAYGLICVGPVAAGDAQIFNIDWNSIILEEVTTINNPSSSPANYYPKATAVTSKDNIDQSLDAGGAYTNTYAIPTSINEGATHRQTFTPTKKKQQGIAVWPIENGTGDWTITVHDASNNVIGTPATIANASVTEGALLSFLNAFDWTTGAYHFHITSTVNDGTVKANTSNDLETASFTTLYSKNTDNFTFRTDTQTLSVTAPTTDGWEDGEVIDTATLGIPPLVLAPGANTVYVSSNGTEDADGTVDPSMQVKLAGKII